MIFLLYSLTLVNLRLFQPVPILLTGFNFTSYDSYHRTIDKGVSHITIFLCNCQQKWLVVLGLFFHSCLKLKYKQTYTVLNLDQMQQAADMWSASRGLCVFR